MDQVKTTGNDMDDFDDAELEELYSWIDGIPLSRPKRNIARDFSDGGKYIEENSFPNLYIIMLIFFIYQLVSPTTVICRLSLSVHQIFPFQCTLVSIYLIINLNTLTKTRSN